MVKKMAEKKTIYLMILSGLLFGLGIIILIFSIFAYLTAGDVIYLTNMALLLIIGIGFIIAGIIVVREIVKE